MFEYLERQSKPVLVLLGLLLTGLIFLADYLMGPESSVLIFYILPVFLVTWFAGRRAGILICCAEALAWYGADVLNHPPSHPLVPVWNAAVRWSVFMVLACTVAEAHESNRRKEELTQFIVHDLRSPLTNVLTGLRTLQQGTTLDELQMELVEMAVTSANRMLTLINSLLDLPRFETGAMPLQVRAVPVRELLDTAVEQVALWARQNEVTLAVEPESGVGPVQADPAVTGRVLVNLLGNALKFSPAGSTVTLLATPDAEGMARFSVSDQGPGIPPEWVDRVFDRYAQVEQRKSGGHASTGLGLTFCRLAVEAHGGRIWVESELGKGTAVFFTLPRETSGAQIVETRGLVPGHKVVEDNPPSVS